MVKIVENGVNDFVAMTVGKSDGGGHVLLAAHLGDALDGVSRHGELGPSVANEACPRGEAETIVATLSVAGGAETDRAKGAMTEIIGVFFVGLHLSAERETHVQAEG